jgi:hypothetical protein
MKNRNAASIISRLRAFADSAGQPVDQICSLKFRPLMEGKYPDQFDRLESSAYMYGSEYEIVRSLCQPSVLSPALAASIARHTTHPSPWSSDSSEFVWGFGSQHGRSSVIGVQHETGWEIIGHVADILGIAAFLWQVWEATRKKVDENAGSSSSDRRWKQVTNIRIEQRFTLDGQLLEERIEVEQAVTVPIQARRLNLNK